MSQVVGRLEPLFNPRSVALVGASNDPGKWGFIVLFNLINGRFPGKVYAVNPRQKEILGLQVYHSVAELPETPDLAVIVVPPSSILQVIQDCLDKGIRAGVVITAGFAEVGELFDIEELALGNRQLGIEIRLKVSQKVRLWRFPVEAIWNSETGVERIREAAWCSFSPSASPPLRAFAWG